MSFHGDGYKSILASMISLRDVLLMMEAEDEQGYQIPFSLRFVTYDKQKQTGGEIIDAKKAVLLKSGKKDFERKTGIRNKEDPDQIKKKPNHFKNRTRNIMLLPSKQIRKVHIYLITRFNDERVY